MTAFILTGCLISQMGSRGGACTLACLSWMTCSIRCIAFSLAVRGAGFASPVFSAASACGPTSLAAPAVFPAAALAVPAPAAVCALTLAREWGAGRGVSTPDSAALFAPKRALAACRAGAVAEALGASVPLAGLARSSARPRAAPVSAALGAGLRGGTAGPPESAFIITSSSPQPVVTPPPFSSSARRRARCLRRNGALSSPAAARAARAARR